MSDLLSWLTGLGLAKYAEVFADNAIDADILHDLTEADFEKVGIPLGHRKKLLRAIEALKSHVGIPGGAGLDAPPGPSRGSAGSSSGQAERRQLTVMFVDLVGSTELSRRLDPEEMGDVIRAYHNLVAAEVGRFDGHVAKFMGDGVLAYFGWPKAHEDDAERAVRAGLAVTGAVAGLDTPAGTPLSARVGIATGMVMVGELLGQGAAREEVVVGETPNLAARLQTLSEPGSVVIASATRKLIGRTFDLADLGRHELKGFSEPRRAWRVTGEGRAEGRFEALHGRRLTAFVGRTHEVGLLVDRFERAREGDGQVVLISGEPGVGKSRIVRALRRQLGDDSYTPFTMFCSPFRSNSPFYPVIGHFERAAGFARDDTAERRLERLEALLAQSAPEVGENAPFVAALLSIPTSERYPPLNLTPERQRQRTLDILVDQVEGLARNRPVLAIIEDVHWIDPSTLEFLERIIQRVRPHPILVLITFRPEYVPPWTGHPHVTSLALGRLGRREGAAMVRELTNGKDLPTEVLEQVLAKTEGVPLFLEELTKTVLESGLLVDAGDRFMLSGPLPPLAIPATLRDSLMARLDRLALVKDTAQLAAALGREFSHELVMAVWPGEESKTADGLHRLVEAELIFRRGTPPQATYTFKHALVQDAAYASLLKSRRQEIHARIARVLNDRFASLVAAQPDLLAHHQTEAGETDAAIDSWLSAGQRAAQRSANREAVAHLRRGLALLESLPDSEERARRELALHLALGGPMQATLGYAATETGAVFARAKELCERLGATTELIRVLFGQWAYYMVRGNHRRALDLAQETRRVADRERAEGPAMVAVRMLGVSHFVRGELSQSRAELDQVLALYDPDRHRPLAFSYGTDVRSSALSFLALVLWLQGFPDQATKAREEAVSWAREVGHAFSLGYALALDSLVMAWSSRDRSMTRQQARSAMAFSAEQGLALWRAWAELIAAVAGIEGSNEPDPLAETRKAWNQLDRTETVMFKPCFLCLQADSLGRIGRAEEGLSLIAQAIAVTEQTDERFWEAEIHRLKGELLLSFSNANTREAEACYETALDVARRQEARSLELRAAMSLARLWAERGERRRAHDLLAPVHGWFTEGFDTPDLIEAKALLAGLA